MHGWEMTDRDFDTIGRVMKVTDVMMIVLFILVIIIVVVIPEVKMSVWSHGIEAILIISSIFSIICLSIWLLARCVYEGKLE